MKVFIALCLIGIAAANNYVQKTCRGGPEPGPCRASIISYYYDERANTCKKFLYGGCEGNGNQYSTEAECLRNCRGTTRPGEDPRKKNEVCNLAPEEGPCRAAIPRYYYNFLTRRCEEFLYGGCEGNGNNFRSREDCQRVCSNDDYPIPRAVPSDERDSLCYLDQEPGMCMAYMPRYYYNHKSGKCEKFIYGGCQGNANNFESVTECEATCNVPQAALDRPDCDKAAEPGLCKAYMPRYYYDQKAGMCKKFVYGGCGGNRNNFKSEFECYNKCGALAPTSDVCQQEKVVGPCRAAFRRYFHNKETGQCELFIYGGCKGNGNNFERKEDCETTCVA